jgi:phage baseplate assembly protein W
MINKHMATTNRRTRQFSDINLLFTANPVTGDVTKKIDEEAIKASVKNLISTNNYERLFHPEIGCQIHGLLFENFYVVTREIMKKTVFDVINKFEPRVAVLDVSIEENLDSNGLDVEVTFLILNTERPVTLNTTLTRVR